MQSRLAVVVVVPALLTALDVQIEGAWKSLLDVTVRVHDTSGQPRAVRTEALETAAAILAGAQTRVQWRICDERDERGRDDVCGSSPGGGTLLVRILRPSASPRLVSGSALGFAAVDTETGAGVLATVYANRVEQRAVAADVPRGWLLGQVIAHELGHLLLGMPGHAAGGLMRDRWTIEELRLGMDRDWKFSPDEVLRIRMRPLLRPDAAWAGVIRR